MWMQLVRSPRFSLHSSWFSGISPTEAERADEFILSILDQEAPQKAELTFWGKGEKEVVRCPSHARRIGNASGLPGESDQNMHLVYKL